MKQLVSWSFLTYFSPLVFILFLFWLNFTGGLNTTVGLVASGFTFLGLCLNFLMSPVKRFRKRNQALAFGVLFSYFIAFVLMVYLKFEAFLLLLLLGIFYYLFIKKEEETTKRIETQQLQTYISELEANNTQLQLFLHDYKNILFSIKGYVAQQDLLGLENFVTEELHLVQTEHPDEALTSLKEIAISPVKTLLLNKFLLAQSLQIKMVLETVGPVDQKNLHQLFVLRSLGIMLDNALEASYHTSLKTFEVGIFQEDQQVKIIVKNPYEDFLPPLHTLKEKGFTTKKNHNGLGLWHLQNMVASQDNFLLDTQLKNNEFIQILTIVGT